MSIQRFLIERLLRLQVKRRLLRDPDIMVLRRVMEAQEPLVRPVPLEVRVTAVDMGGIACERLTPDGAPGDRVIFYVHGGGWVAGNPKVYRPFLWRLAKGSGIAVLTPDYRLAPEHPFPAGLDDVRAAYGALLAQGFGSDQIIAGGDSAGGNLILALMLRLKDEGIGLPRALFCLSPATDMTDTGGSILENARHDALFVPDMMGSAARAYAPGRDIADPMLSPLRGDLSGLPPTLIHVAHKEMLRDQSIKLAGKLKAAGVPVEIEVWPKVWHVWHLTADMLPEARAAIAKLARFIRAQAGMAD